VIKKKSDSNRAGYDGLQAADRAKQGNGKVCDKMGPWRGLRVGRLTPASGRKGERQSRALGVVEVRRREDGSCASGS